VTPTGLHCISWPGWVAVRERYRADAARATSNAASPTPSKHARQAACVAYTLLHAEKEPELLTQLDEQSLLVRCGGRGMERAFRMAHSDPASASSPGLIRKGSRTIADSHRCDASPAGRAARGRRVIRRDGDVPARRVVPWNIGKPVL